MNELSVTWDSELFDEREWDAVENLILDEFARNVMMKIDYLTVTTYLFIN